MTSTPSTHSEGEIFTSDSEKATQTLPSHNGISVDRHTRTNASSLRNSRSRSRSPYRAPRGEKRHRDDGPTEIPGESDPRLQKPRYESDRYLSDRSHGRRPRFDSDLRHRKRSHHAYDYENDRRLHSKRPRTRSRTRSRSPFRHSHSEKPFARSDAVNRSKLGDPEQNDQAKKNWRRDRDEESVSEQSKPSGIALASKSNAKTSENQSSHTGSKHASSPSTFEYVLGGNWQHNTDQISSLGPDASTGTEHEITGLPAVIDDTALIEERRKRREALKARYRNQETPLLVQALHLGAEVNSSASSSVTTPQTGQQSAMAAVSNPKEVPLLPGSAGPTSPQTPNETPQSPAELSFDQGENLANSHSGSVAGEEDEPSAADYDPTVDMQEERARHDKRLFNEDISISADEEKKVLEQDQVGPEMSTQAVPKSGPAEPNKQKDPFDMFAEDDDDVDMFAEAPPKSANPSIVTDKKTAQSLDVKMMDNWDDSEGYYMTIPGELFESRYHVLQNLGRGMFSSVVRATDTKTNKLVAIKIVRNNDTMRKAGIKEIEILKDLAASDPEDKKHLIRLERSFEHKGHLCMVFENLSLNLREVLKKFGRDVGINLKAIRAYAQQLFLGLSLLRKCQYLHADLKPDNILVNEARNVLKICDLGSASSIDENVTAPYLVSRFYRAPEIILGIPYDYGIDVWSVGCTLFELYTGKILFTGRNNNSMLRSIMECRGKFPHKVLRKGSLTYQYFDDLLNFQSVEEDKLTGRTVTKMIDIKAKPVRGLRERLVPKGKKMDEQERKEVELFADLLDKCLDLRGDKRLTPSETLRHPFITRTKT
jgi:serine/threonine-protein kinase PRP4